VSHVVTSATDLPEGRDTGPQRRVTSVEWPELELIGFGGLKFSSFVSWIKS